MNPFLVILSCALSVPLGALILCAVLVGAYLGLNLMPAANHVIRALWWHVRD